MKRSHSTSRFNLAPDQRPLLGLLLGLLLCLVAAPAPAQDSLRAFTASYDLHRSGMHFATAELSLEPMGNHWRWRLTTAARGVYAMLYSKKPYTETTFNLTRNELRLHKIVLSDENDEDTEDFESVDFDWGKGKMKVMRKGKRKQATLLENVYDYQSIHLLAASMQARQLQEVTVSFYYKGKLTESTLVYQGTADVDVDNQPMSAQVFEQTVSGSRTRSRYYYDSNNPILPLRIETSKDDDGLTIFRLRSVSWRS